MCLAGHSCPFSYSPQPLVDLGYLSTVRWSNPLGPVGKTLAARARSRCFDQKAHTQFEIRWHDAQQPRPFPESDADLLAKSKVLSINLGPTLAPNLAQACPPHVPNRQALPNHGPDWSVPGALFSELIFHKQPFGHRAWNFRQSAGLAALALRCINLFVPGIL